MEGAQAGVVTFPPLAQSLKTELAAARRKRGRRNLRTIERSNGLTIDLYVGYGWYHLRLRRVWGTIPGKKDVATVLRAWPMESRPSMAALRPTVKESILISRAKGPEYNCICMKWKMVKPAMGGGT